MPSSAASSLPDDSRAARFGEASAAQADERLAALASLRRRAESLLWPGGVGAPAIVDRRAPESSLALHGRLADHSTESCIYAPTAVLVLQGTKSSLLGEGRFVFEPGSFLLASVPMPAQNFHATAAPGKPFISISVALSPAMLADAVMALPAGASRGSAASSPSGGTLPEAAVSKGIADLALIGAFARLVEAAFAGDEAERALLAPLALREIHCRLLLSSAGASLRRIHAPGSASKPLERVIQEIRRRYAEPLPLGELAAEAHMSESALYRRFKRLTTLSPLQYQKQLRLYEAKRLMLSRGLDAQQAGYAVGYASPQQFSRDYKRLFGRPPRADAAAAQPAAL